MNIARTIAFLAIALILGGCAAVPQQAVQASPDAFAGSRIGVAMTALPKVDTHFVGADCLLCMAAAAVANSSLTDHARTLPYEDLPQLKDAVAEQLRQRGAEVTVIPGNLNFDDFPDIQDRPNYSDQDYSSLRQQYQIDKLLVINIATLGFYRTYSAYIPTSDPKAYLHGASYLVNLSDHAYEWYAPIGIFRSADGEWDEPPAFPGLTNAYFQALELGKDSILKPIGSDGVAVGIAP